MILDRRIVVTGGAGFVGRQAVKALLNEGFEVHIFDLVDPKIGAAIFHEVNLLNTHDFFPIFEAIKPSHLMHLAWTVTPGKFWTDPVNLDWVSASLGLMTAFSKAGGQRIIGSGTCAEYDWSFEYLVENETPTLPHTLYGVAKSTFHQLLDAYAMQANMSYAWGRLFFLYGPNEARGRLVSDITNAFLTGETVECSEGLQVRDFMHIEDAGAAFAALAISDITGPVNIASGEATTVRNVIEILESETGRSNLAQFGVRPIAENDPPILSPSMTRLFEEVRFTPKHTLKTGLSGTVDWWRKKLES